MTKFRKKPIVIEAIQWDGKSETVLEIDGLSDDTIVLLNSQRLGIPTKEGDMVASFGDWIIKGIEGEIYPCKPNIFDATYELVEDEEDTNPNDLRYN